MTFDVNKIPKAELHCHLEGAASPELIKRLALKNGIDLSAKLFDNDGNFQWNNFIEFLQAYDMASAAIITAADYADVVYEYLCQCAVEGAIYVELFSSSDHAAAAGLGYIDQLEGMINGIDRAEEEYGIIGRLIPTCVRHLGVDSAIAVADQVVNNLHPYVVGFGMGGDEAHLSLQDFAPAYKIVDDAGLATTVHAGEMQGAASVRDAINYLPVSRIGHGVNVIDDMALVDELIKRDIHLEICPGSNISLSVFDDYQSHPLLKLKAAGILFSLNSDDPPYFDTTIGKEYQNAHDQFNLGEQDLVQITKTAINAAFIDDIGKQKLLLKLSKYG